MRGRDRILEASEGGVDAVWIWDLQQGGAEDTIQTVKASHMDANGLEKLIGRLYTAFVLRDLTFFVSGALVIAELISSPVDTLAKALSDSEAFQWLGMPAFLALSYVLGVILQESVRVPLEPFSNWWVKRKRGRSEPPGRLVVRMEDVYRNRSLHTALGIERVLFLKQVAATQCSALAMIAILAGFKVKLNLEFPWWAFLVSSLVWAAMYVDKSLQEDDILVGLQPKASAESPGR